jgi:hypothetical protein
LKNPEESRKALNGSKLSALSNQQSAERMQGPEQPEIVGRPKKSLVLSSWFLVAMRNLWRSRAGRLEQPEIAGNEEKLLVVGS